MKLFKGVTSLVLAMAIIMSMSVTGIFADTVERETKKEEVTVLKISDENFRKHLVEGVKVLDVANLNIGKLDGLKYFKSLEKLHCENNYMTELDVRGNLQLTHLFCYMNKLTAIDLSKNIELIMLYSYGNEIPRYNLFSNKKLAEVWLNGDEPVLFEQSKNVAPPATPSVPSVTPSVPSVKPTPKPDIKPEVKPTPKPEGIKVTSTVESESKTDSTGKAEATVKVDAVKDSLKKVLEAVKKAEAEGKKDVKPVVEVKVKANKTATAVETKLPASALKEVSSDSKAELKVSTPVGDINLDNKALKEIAKNAGAEEVKLSIAKPEVAKMSVAQKKEVEKIAAGRPVLELAVTAGTKKISSFGGGSVTVSVPYTVAKGENADNLVVYFVDDNGKATPMETSYDAKTGKINFKTGHFSTYVVGYRDEANTIKDLDLRLTSTVTKGKIKITWKGSDANLVDGYEVFRSTKKFSGYGKTPYYKTSNEKKTNYINTKGLKKGTRYFYKVRAYKYVDGKKIYSDWSTKAYRIAK